MVDETRVYNAISNINAILGELGPYKLVMLPPSAIRILSENENARYMPGPVFNQLVENIRRDGALSSLPLLWKTPTGEFVCLSGNHRVMAAQAAGVEYILALYTDAELSDDQRIAIQLSHNSIVGFDDPERLRMLWRQINDLQRKVYSGLDDASLQTLPKLSVVIPSEDRLHFEEIRLLFVKPEIDHINALMKEIGDTARTVWLAPLSEFDGFFSALLDLKEAKNILNTSTAILVMAELTRDALQNMKHNDKK